MFFRGRGGNISMELIHHSKQIILIFYFNKEWYLEIYEETEEGKREIGYWLGENLHRGVQYLNMRIDRNTNYREIWLFCTDKMAYFSKSGLNNLEKRRQKDSDKLKIILFKNQSKKDCGGIWKVHSQVYSEIQTIYNLYHKRKNEIYPLSMYIEENLKKENSSFLYIIITQFVILYMNYEHRVLTTVQKDWLFNQNMNKNEQFIEQVIEKININLRFHVELNPIQIVYLHFLNQDIQNLFNQSMFRIDCAEVKCV